MSRLSILKSFSWGRLSILKKENECPICGADLTEGDGIYCPNCKERIIIDQSDKNGLKITNLKLKTR